MKITNVRIDDNKIVGIKLEDGQEILGLNNIKKAYQEGKLEGYNWTERKDGVEYLRDNPDDDSSDNLKNLPRF